MLRQFLVAALIACGVCGTPGMAAAQTPTKGRVLVVLSSAQELELREGKRYPTGFFLNEVATPVQALIRAGYEPVFANPQGNKASWDPKSAVPGYFGGSQEKLEAAKLFVEGLEGLKQPRTLAAVRAEGINGYMAILVPGGHAPMQDLLIDKDLGALLNAFQAAGKTTALICHGPIALLSTLPDAAAFRTAMINGDANAAQKLAANWSYAGYRMTAFSTSEERGAEARLLGGQVRFYPAEALAQAGGRVVSGPDRRSLTVQDRELITGQQPLSDEEFATLVIGTLDRIHAGK